MRSPITIRYFKVVKVIYGDVTGDGKEDAVVTTEESGGGSGVDTGALVFTLRNGRPVTLQSKTRDGDGPYDGITGGDRGGGGIFNISIRAGQIIVEQYRPGKGSNDPPYHQKYIESGIYEWNGQYLPPVGGVTRRVIPKSGK